MKVAPFFIPKKFLVNQLNKRNAYLAETRVMIDKNLPKENRDVLNQSRLTLAKFAKRNNCSLSFVKNESGTQMNVNRMHKYTYSRNSAVLQFKVPEKEGEAVLPESSNKKDIISFIKDKTKLILESVKNKNTRHLEFVQADALLKKRV